MYTKEQRREYYLKNKEKILAKNKKYRDDNKEKVLKRRKELYTANIQKHREVDRKRHEKNKEKRNKACNEYYKKNAEKLKAAVHEYYQRNKEALKRYNKQWVENNRQRVNANCAKRRAAKLQRTVKWADMEKIIEIYNNCPKDKVVDHIIPLQGKNVSGLHVEYNLQYLTPVENGQKWNKF